MHSIRVQLLKQRNEFEPRKDRLYRYGSTSAYNSFSLLSAQINRIEVSEGFRWPELFYVPFTELQEKLAFSRWMCKYEFRLDALKVCLQISKGLEENMQGK